MQTTEYLAFGKTLLAGIYFKVYITKLPSVYIIYNISHAFKGVYNSVRIFYIFEDFSDLENLSLLNIELTLILQFCLLDDLLKLFFVLDASIFTTIYEKKEEQKSTLQIFLKDVTEKKNWKFINTIDSQ